MASKVLVDPFDASLRPLVVTFICVPRTIGIAGMLTPESTAGPYVRLPF